MAAVKKEPEDDSPFHTPPMPPVEGTQPTGASVATTLGVPRVKAEPAAGDVGGLHLRRPAAGEDGSAAAAASLLSPGAQHAASGTLPPPSPRTAAAGGRPHAMTESFRQFSAELESKAVRATTPGPAGRPFGMPAGKLSFLSFLGGELSPETLSASRGGTNVVSSLNRSKVYDLFKVPLNLEKLLGMGYIVCLDSFLALFTFLPLRVVLSVLILLKYAIARVLGLHSGRGRVLSAVLVCDVLRFLLMLSTCWCLIQIDISQIYHYIRVQSVLKLYVIYNCLEVIDKLCSSFGQDIFDALFWTANDRPGLRPLADFCVAAVYNFIHSLVLLLQIICISVAVNSHNNVLLTLLVSNQFVELKSHVFKSLSTESLFQITCADIAERFQIVVFLAFAVMQNLANVNWQPTIATMYDLGFVIVIVFASELVTDYIKHAFVTKFNSFRPTIYSKFRFIILGDVLAARSHASFSDHSLVVARRIGFVSLPLACLTVRFAGPQLLGNVDSYLLPVIFLNLLVFKILLGILLLRMAIRNRFKHGRFVSSSTDDVDQSGTSAQSGAVDEAKADDLMHLIASRVQFSEDVLGEEEVDDGSTWVGRR